MQLHLARLAGWHQCCVLCCNISLVAWQICVALLLVGASWQAVDDVEDCREYSKGHSIERRSKISPGLLEPPSLEDSAMRGMQRVLAGAEGSTLYIYRGCNHYSKHLQTLKNKLLGMLLLLLLLRDGLANDKIAYSCCCCCCWVASVAWGSG